MLTHVRDAKIVIGEMARVLKPGGVFFAAEYTDSDAVSGYDNVSFPKRDEAWHREYLRINLLLIRGKHVLGRGDDRAGGRVPVLATQTRLGVYDVRLNDLAIHVFPPYRHEKQKHYLELSKTVNATDTGYKWLRLTIETIVAGGGTEEDGRWYYSSIDSAGIVRAIDDGAYIATASFALYPTFAGKP